ncbi:MAG: tyrosine-type recombinase/integrase [Mesorhizobium sp.]|nr:site-specific integrase [Mesorhizobium sp.]MBL8578350.1 tyrosine-type recombinase/integrase [Mesorhizobium sp.]
MGRNRRALSQREVDAVTKTGLTWADDNLYVQRRDDGTRSWVFRYERDGRVRSLGLGALARVSLEKARKLAGAHRVTVWDGGDPVADKKVAKQQARAQVTSAAPTFERVAKEYIATREASHKSPEAQRQWPSSLRDHVHPIFGRKPVDQVGLDDVHRALSPIWTSMYPTAKKVRGRIAAVLDYAAAKGWRPDDNPARSPGPLDALLPPSRHREKHHASVPYQDLPAVVAKLRRLDSISAKCLLLVILTGVRSGEARLAEWSEFDLDGGLWTIPTEHTKTSQEHRVPLSAQAMELLRSIPRKGKLVFPNPKTKAALSYNALMEVQKSLRKATTVHGYRATLSTWAREQTSYSEEVIEWCLAHGTVKVTAAYARTTRLDERRPLMQEYADYAYALS